MRLLTTLSLVFVLAVSSAPNPGVIFEIEKTDYTVSPERVQTFEVIVEGPKLKIPFQSLEGSGASSAMIFRGDQGDHGTMLVVNHEEQYYMVMDEKTIKEMGAKVAEAEKAMEQAMKNLTPEQQEMIKQAQESGMGGMGIPPAPADPPEIEVKKTGDSSRMEGYPCVKYVVYSDGTKIRELWVTDWGNIKGAEEAEEAFKRMSAFSEMMMEALPQSPGSDLGPFGQAQFDVGFPVVTRGFDDAGNVTEESTLKSTRRERIDPAAFEPPTGYRRVSMGP